MALGEAKAKARLEFQQALESTGKSLDDIRRYVDQHPILRRPFYNVPHRKGMTGTALTVWMQTSHPTMPNIVLTKQETLDVVAYILSLKGRE